MHQKCTKSAPSICHLLEHFRHIGICDVNLGTTTFQNNGFSGIGCHGTTSMGISAAGRRQAIGGGELDDGGMVGSALSLGLALHLCGFIGPDLEDFGMECPDADLIYDEEGGSMGDDDPSASRLAIARGELDDVGMVGFDDKLICDDGEDPLTAAMVGPAEAAEFDDPLAAIGIEGLPCSFLLEACCMEGLELDDGGLVGCSEIMDGVGLSEACCMEEAPEEGAPDDDGDDPLAAIGLELDDGLVLCSEFMGLPEACCMEEAPDDEGDDPSAAIGLELDDGGLVGCSAELVGGVGLLEAWCMEEAPDESLAAIGLELDDGGLVAEFMSGAGLLEESDDDEFVDGSGTLLFLLVCEIHGPAPSSPSSISFSSGSIFSRTFCTTLRSPAPLYCAIALGHDDKQKAHFLKWYKSTRKLRDEALNITSAGRSSDIIWG